MMHGLPLDGGDAVCPSCAYEWPPSLGPVCARCGFDFMEYQVANGVLWHPKLGTVCGWIEEGEVQNAVAGRPERRALP